MKIGYKAVGVSLLKIILIFSGIIFVKAGKSATKVGLAGITQFHPSSSGHEASHANQENGFMKRNNENRTFESALKKLKYNLFNMQGYDKAIRPVKNSTDVVVVYVDFTYMQVLDLNEKDQTLKSLLRYRLYWTDQYLTWEPEDYDGITNIWLPTRALWFPDIVCQEETGSRDFNPKIPFLVVNNKGKVRYLEPIAYETTCQVKIANFPFDKQICTFTFTSWTFPTTKMDVLAKRTGADINEDIRIYFSSDGEWDLEDINVSKTATNFAKKMTGQSWIIWNIAWQQFYERLCWVSQSYLSVLPEESGYGSVLPAEENITTKQFYELGPLELVIEAVPERFTDAHWSEVRFRLVFRRNFSLYIQSMLFPAILLTTISLLGFYLPPDSGERIGLQITILLTFMVFILTVGDMFPASTGPYLGVYFVLCMALLGINIIMTVLVLYLHHVPHSLVIQTNTITGITHTKLNALPLWIKLSLKFSGLYEEISNFVIPEPECPKQKDDQSYRSRISSAWAKWKNAIAWRKETKVEDHEAIRTMTQHNKSLISTRNKLISTAVSNHILHCKTPTDANGTLRRRDTCKTQCDSQDTSSFDDLCITNDKNKVNAGSLLSDATVENTTSKPEIKREILYSQKSMLRDLGNISQNVGKISCFACLHSSDMKQKQIEDTMQEKWRSIARKIDVVCMYTYIGFLVIFHIGIAIAIAFGI